MKMCLVKLLLLSVLTAGCANCAASLRLVNNRYDNVVVAVDDTVAEKHCQYLIAGLMQTMNDASRLLYLATNRRASFHNVTIVLPNHWPESCLSLATDSQSTPMITHPLDRQADVRVGPDHPVFSSRPWSLQWGQCGQPGSSIGLPASSLTQLNNHTAQDVVAEWAKYRWGVYEETGFAGDPMYPSFYQSEKNQWSPTICANKTTSGTISPAGCKKEKNECTFTPSASEFAGSATDFDVGQSLLSLASSFCSETSHNSVAPTKHNLLCQGRSVSQVILNSEDFSAGRNPPGTALQPGPVHFQFAAASAAVSGKFYWLVESSSAMRRSWPALRDSVVNYASWQAPAGLWLGVALFGRGYSEKRPLSPLVDGVRSFPGWQPYVDDVSEAQKSWLSAINGALDSMASQARGSTIVMVTGSSQPHMDSQFSDNDVTAMADKLKKLHVRLVVIFHPYATAGLGQLARETGGEVIHVSQAPEPVVPLLYTLMSTYDRIVSRYAWHGHRQRQLLEQNQFSSPDQLIGGTFVVDSQQVSEQVTLLILLNERRQIRSIRLRNHNRQTDPDRIFSTNSFEVVAQFSVAEGEWQYEVELYEPFQGSVYVEVSTMSSSADDSIRLRTWTASGRSQVWNASVSPLALYAQLARGNSALLNAEVYAVIDRSDGVQHRLQLLDNGLAVPDITRGDGVYSRYYHDLLTTSNESSLELRIHVEVSGNRAALLKGVSAEAGGAQCCGSSVPLNGAVLEPVSHLRRISQPISVRVVNLPPTPSDDIYPPNRITDLRAHVNRTRGTVTFQWTAPEDSALATRVARYEVRYCEQLETLRRHFIKCTSVPHWTQPEPYLTHSRAEIEFNVYDRLVHFAMRAQDETGNVAPPSNIVAVVMPQPVLPSLSRSAAGTNPESQEASSTAGSLSTLLTTSSLTTLAVCLAAGVVLVLIIMLFTCLHRRRTSERKSGDNNSVSAHKIDTATATNTYCSPLVGKLGADVSKTDATPVMWSASEILRSHSNDLASGSVTSSSSSVTATTTGGGSGGGSGGDDGVCVSQSTKENLVGREKTFSNYYQLHHGESGDWQASQSVGYLPDQLSHPVYNPLPSTVHLRPEHNLTINSYIGVNDTVKTAPPTYPKPLPSATAHTAVHLPGFLETMNEKRRRNVTQV